MATVDDGNHPSKRLRTDDAGSAIVLASNEDHSWNQQKLRTSSLDHPTMKLTGHSGPVHALAFDPIQGESLVSASFDMTCLLWNATGACENYNVLEGHKNAILNVKWSSTGEHIVTASADKTLGWYDAATGTRIKKLQGHLEIVNAVDTAKKTSNDCLLTSASDDKTARLWDTRVRGGLTGTIMEHDYQVTSIAFADETNMVYTGGIDNIIYAWDIRQQGQKVFSMHGKHNNHNKRKQMDTITCLALHPQSTHVLSNSMDGTIRSWNVQPFVGKQQQRLEKSFVGATHNAEKGLLQCAWSANGSMVTGGSADGMVHIWDEMTAQELYLLPGHVGCVNSVVFHPKENIIASGSTDQSIFVGELG